MIVACLHHLDQPFLGHAEAPLREAGLELDERCIPDGEPLPAVGEVDAVISFGGAQSAVPSALDPRLDGELALLRDAVQAGLPVLGICLGGQLLSRALGGTVTRARRRAIEWRELTPRPGVEDPLLAALPPAVPALHWNEDVFTLPPGAVELLGWVPREVAAELAPELDAGTAWSALVLREQRPSPRDPRTGVTVLLARAPSIELRVVGSAS